MYGYVRERSKIKPSIGPLEKPDGSLTGDDSEVVEMLALIEMVVLLDDMLERCGPLHQKDIALDLLEKFDLAVEVPVDTKFNCKDEDDSYEVPTKDRVFVLPSMLMYNKMKVYQKQAEDLVVL